jgi:hypothetical protein
MLTTSDCTISVPLTCLQHLIVRFQSYSHAYNISLTCLQHLIVRFQSYSHAYNIWLCPRVATIIASRITSTTWTVVSRANKIMVTRGQLVVRKRCCQSGTMELRAGGLCCLHSVCSNLRFNVKLTRMTTKIVIAPSRLSKVWNTLTETRKVYRLESWGIWGNLGESGGICPSASTYRLTVQLSRLTAAVRPCITSEQSYTTGVCRKVQVTDVQSSHWNRSGGIW